MLGGVAYVYKPRASAGCHVYRLICSALQFYSKYLDVDWTDSKSHRCYRLECGSNSENCCYSYLFSGILARATVDRSAYCTGCSNYLEPVRAVVCIFWYIFETIQKIALQIVCSSQGVYTIQIVWIKTHFNHNQVKVR